MTDYFIKSDTQLIPILKVGDVFEDLPTLVDFFQVSFWENKENCALNFVIPMGVFAKGFSTLKYSRPLVITDGNKEIFALDKFRIRQHGHGIIRLEWQRPRQLQINYSA